MRVVQKSNTVKQKGSGIGRTILSTIALIAAFIASLLFLLGIASPKRLNETQEISELYTTVDSEGGTYFGPITNWDYSGFGEFHYLEGGVYEGEFDRSVRSGTGTYVWSDGDTYTGTWTNDQMVKGKYVWANGDAFEGTFEKNAMVSGTYTFSNGTYYEGSFSNSKFSDGILTLSTANLEESFKSYKVQYKSGAVTEVTIDYQAKSGYKFNGAVTGKAVINYPNGDTYDGDVMKGKRSGTGTYEWKDSNGKTVAKYTGGWSEDKMSGYGTYYFSNNNYPNLRGTFDNGKPTGTAVYNKEAGNTFATTWKNGICTKVTET